MIKLLMFIFLLLVIYYVRRVVQGGHSSTRTNTQQPIAREAETMGECAHCGVLVPMSEGRQANGLFYCSAEHESLGPREVK